VQPSFTPSNKFILKTQPGFKRRFPVPPPLQFPPKRGRPKSVRRAGPEKPDGFLLPGQPGRFTPVKSFLPAEKRVFFTGRPRTIGPENEVYTKIF
jgi:hypothetical protein